MTQEEYNKAKRRDRVYYARMMPSLGYYEIHELHMVSIYDDYCSASDVKTKQAFILSTKEALELLYIDRADALKYLKKKEKENKHVRVIRDKIKLEDDDED